jgi:hypothetical protein
VQRCKLAHNLAAPRAAARSSRWSFRSASCTSSRALGRQRLLGIDAEYTRIIRQNPDDPRMTTELVDHPPADRVPTLLVPRRAAVPGD